MKKIMSMKAAKLKALSRLRRLTRWGVAAARSMDSVR
jgi:hypothetical protein